MQNVVSALRPAFFILYLESFISRLNVIPCHDLTLSVGEPDNAAAKQGQELRSEQTVTPLHEQDHLYLFLRLNNSETFVELVGARPLHLLSQTALPLKSPTGAFIAALRKRGPTPNPAHGSHLTVRTATACRAYITSPRSYRTDRRYNDQNECSTDP